MKTEYNRCQTCGHLLYRKKGYNKKSLDNLVSRGHNRKQHNEKRKASVKKQCVINKCKNIRIKNSILCIDHYLNRIRQTEMHKE